MVERDENIDVDGTPQSLNPVNLVLTEELNKEVSS